jgi:hypothetical protein
MTLLLEEQKKAFTDALEALNEEGMLRYVVIIGSWAEYLYECAFPWKGFTANLRTRDVDVLIPNRARLRGKKNFVETMQKRGYGLAEDPVTGVSKFYREDLLEVQFVVRSLGSGVKDVVEVPGLGIKTEALRHLNLLKENPISVYYEGLNVKVPAPEAYVLQKLAIQSDKNQPKREKDLEGVRMVLDRLVNPEKMSSLFQKLQVKERDRISKAAELHHLKLPLGDCGTPHSLDG